MPRPRGFTLLELMTGIAVLAILFGIGVPAFTSIVRNNQLAAQSSNLVQALTLARSEAVKRGVRVSVCASNAAATACSTTATWNNGWIVFADDFGTAGVIDASDVQIQRWPAPAGGVQFNMATPAPAVSFVRTGRAESPRTFTVTKSGCTGDQQRQISVIASGRVGLQRQTCS